ncbi:MAG: radical SAM protein [Oscillospiraceae bacterium]|nr:radical SAM protein [Oscillospiraceae bacterium]
MNPYTKNINRIEFVITYACSGRCKHCSEGDHISSGDNINGNKAAEIVRKIAESYDINSLMTFGGEPLLYPETVYIIHAAARDMGIPKRQIITNGFFSRDTEKIQSVAQGIVHNGVNDVLLSVDAFHQETIPIEQVKEFAGAVMEAGIPRLRVHPAWLVSTDADNPYNNRTREILSEFQSMGIEISEGNVIFPSGNALKYLGEYFDPDILHENPYEEDPLDIRTVSVSPNGDVLGGNVYRTDILKILDKYTPD